MDSGGMYRRGSSISSSLQQGSCATSFYPPVDSTVDVRGGGAAMHVPLGVHINLESKIDEMMNMMSVTQQLLLAQQATTKRLEESMAIMSTEVETLQADFKTISEEVSATASQKSGQKRGVPVELKVFINFTA